MAKDVYAFDECSILHSCELEIPNSHSIYFPKPRISHKNFPKLKSLFDKLNKNSIPKYRFEPNNMEINIIKAANELLAKQGSQMIVFSVLKDHFSQELYTFSQKIKGSFEIIQKSEDFEEIKKIFVENKRPLGKERKMPEDDDLMILAGYFAFKSDGAKYLISEDEHFWGYDDLIQDKFEIKVVKEWECDKL